MVIILIKKLLKSNYIIINYENNYFINKLFDISIPLSNIRS